MNNIDVLKVADGVFDKEILALQTVSKKLDKSFIDIVNTLHGCTGKCVVCGMGKSGHIARKIAATLSSLGTPSIFLHPGEAIHGDLGTISSEDVVMLLSNSGETEEVNRLIPAFKLLGVTIIGITGNSNSTMAKQCDIVQALEIDGEAGALNLAPTVSTTVMLVYGDALAIAISEMSGFTQSDFAKYHPGGTLGKRVLLKVDDIMAKGEEAPVVQIGSTITDTIMEMSDKGLGVVAVVTDEGKLCGLLTDGDLRRAIEKRIDLYDGLVDEIMTKRPKAITKDLLLVDVLERLRDSHLNNYPVIDNAGVVIGMLTWQMIIREGIVL